MPHMTGMQLVGRIRYAGMTLPVIIASGSMELADAADYPWLVLTAILHKPFRPIDLISAARAAVSLPVDAPPGSVQCVDGSDSDLAEIPFQSRNWNGSEIHLQGRQSTVH